MSASNGNGEWADVFAVFHARHKDGSGKKLKFTAVFNSHMDAFIGEDEVPLEWRILAWIWRMSWGNNSDFCVEKWGGPPVGQKEMAARFGVDKRRVSDCVVFLRALNFVRADTGQKLYPVDDPAQKPASSEDTKSPGSRGLFADFLADWKVRGAADFQALESARAEVKRLRKVQIAAFKEWQATRTNRPPLLTSSTVNPPVASVGRVVAAPETQQPTDRPIAAPEENPFKPKIREWLEANVKIPGYPLQDPELDQIAATIHTEADFSQFQEAAKQQEKPRGWRVFVKIAQQCAEVRPKYEKARAASAAGSNDDDWYLEMRKKLEPEIRRRR